MAKAKTETKAVDAPHVVKYNDGTEDIVATFPTADHAAVLINRLKSHGVAHTYDKPKEPVEAEQD